ncbi:glycosyltransferase family 32 protein [Xylariaceae sp. AK1471]|nr:glycosyltransferase family 32 protein [Xylariaceae sp. AK1471]
MNVQIPLQYQKELKPIEYGYEATDDEIFHSLLDYKPVTSEKNIWTFWDTGIHGMPAWCQRNVVSWVRMCGPEWTIRVLDSNPESPNYAAKYVPKGLPDAFYNHTLDGMHPGPHTADFLRGACLYDYGGAWMDSSIFLMRHIDRICWNELEDPASPYRVAVPMILGGLLNCFLAARKHDPFIKRWHDLFMYIWQGRNNATGLVQHPLLAPILPYFIDMFEGHNGAGLGINGPIEDLAEYGAQMLCWLRVAMLEDAGDGFSGSDYWKKNVMGIDTLSELLRLFEAGGPLPDFSMGPKLLDLLAIKRDGPRDSEQYREVEKLVWTQLTEASMLKIGTIKGLVDWVSLGTLWNRPENLGKDNEPGTFAELLRYVPLHFQQTRENIKTIAVKETAATFKKGVLEP